MTLSQRIERDYIAAYKEKDQIRLSVLRLLKTAFKNRLVELCQPHGELDDGAIIDIIIKQAKQRQDSIEQYANADRRDLADREKAELIVLESYLPKKLTGEELAAAVEEAIEALGAASPRDMSRVMKYMMEKYKGAADGKVLSEVIKARLAG